MVRRPFGTAIPADAASTPGGRRWMSPPATTMPRDLISWTLSQALSGAGSYLKVDYANANALASSLP